MHLRTAVEHAVVYCRGDKITSRDLPTWVRTAPASPETETRRLLANKDLSLPEAEKQLIIRMLKETDGNRTEAARRLGLSRRTLHRKLHEYHLEGF